MSILISVLVALFSVLIVAFNIGNYVYRRVKHKPVGECKSCGCSKEKILKEYRKFYSK